MSIAGAEEKQGRPDQPATVNVMPDHSRIAGRRTVTGDDPGGPGAGER